MQNIGNVTKVCSICRKTEDLKKLEEALTRIKERVRFGEGFETVQSKDRSRMGWLSPKSPSVLHNENKSRRGGTLEKSGRWPQQACTYDVLFDSRRMLRVRGRLRSCQR